MKKFVFILSFVFAMFFANTSFASTTDNNLVDTKAEIVLTETNEIANVSDDLVEVNTIIIIIIADDTIINIIIQ